MLSSYRSMKLIAAMCILANALSIDAAVTQVTTNQANDGLASLIAENQNNKQITASLSKKIDFSLPGVRYKKDLVHFRCVFDPTRIQNEMSISSYLVSNPQSINTQGRDSIKTYQNTFVVDGGRCFTWPIGDYQPLIDLAKLPSEKKAALLPNIAEAMVSAVHSLHLRGFYQGNLTPSNFLINKNYQTNTADIVLTGFGYSGRLHEQNMPAVLSKDEWFLYKSPESFGSNVIDMKKHDMYGLGANLFHLISNNPPHLALYKQAKSLELFSKTMQNIQRLGDLDFQLNQLNDPDRNTLSFCILLMQKMMAPMVDQRMSLDAFLKNFESYRLTNEAANKAYF
ncbi:kinase-like domain-containing protein [Syncephalis fuscata]|nr:kinase-like domain-containing protein [Syncephalis fuscata]